MSWGPPLQQIDRTYVRAAGRRLSYFAGCDYFRLSTHPRVLQALKRALDRYGLSVAASRRTTGNHELYEQLEKQLALFFGSQRSVLVPSGYSANLAVAQALRGSASRVYIDERAHGSLWDAAALFDCPVVRFRHRSSSDLSKRLIRSPHKTILLTDGMFPIDGALAPIQAYQEALPHDAFMIVDDSHAAGLIGRRGKGTIEFEGVKRDRLIQTITLSKAFGLFGGAILTTDALAKRIEAHSRLLSGSTPFPLPLAAAALEAVSLLGSPGGFRDRLLKNVRFVRDQLMGAGFALPEVPAPIFVFRARRPGDVRMVKRQLLASKIFPPFIQYGVDPPVECFRFVISSEHTQAQLTALVTVLGKCQNRLSGME